MHQHHHNLKQAADKPAQVQSSASEAKQAGYEGTFSRLDDGKSLQQKQKERRQRKAQFLLGDSDDVKGPSVGFSPNAGHGGLRQAVRLSPSCTAQMPVSPNRCPPTPSPIIRITTRCSELVRQKAG